MLEGLTSRSWATSLQTDSSQMEHVPWIPVWRKFGGLELCLMPCGRIAHGNLG